MDLTYPDSYVAEESSGTTGGLDVILLGGGESGFGDPNDQSKAINDFENESFPLSLSPVAPVAPPAPPASQDSAFPPPGPFPPQQEVRPVRPVLPQQPQPQPGPDPSKLRPNNNNNNNQRNNNDPSILDKQRALLEETKAVLEEAKKEVFKKEAAECNEACKSILVPFLGPESPLVQQLANISKVLEDVLKMTTRAANASPRPPAQSS